MKKRAITGSENNWLSIIDRTSIAALDKTERNKANKEDYLFRQYVGTKRISGKRSWGEGGGWMGRKLFIVFLKFRLDIRYP